MRYFYAYIQKISLPDIQRILKSYTLPSYSPKDVLVPRVMLMVCTATSENRIRTIDPFDGKGHALYTIMHRIQACELGSVLDLQQL